MFFAFSISSLYSPKVTRFGRKQYGPDSSRLSFLFFFSSFLIFLSDQNKRKNSLFFSPPFSLSKENASDAKGREVIIQFWRRGNSVTFVFLEVLMVILVLIEVDTFFEGEERKITSLFSAVSVSLKLEFQVVRSIRITENLVVR